MDRQGMLLAALAAGEANASFSPVQVQKLFFLIDREVPELVDGPHFNFAPYDYGPFDRAVYDELRALSSDGLVNVDISDRYRKYILTRQGYQRGIKELNKLPEKASSFVTRAAKWVQELDFQQLVGAIYKRYPEMTINSVFNE